MSSIEKKMCYGKECYELKQGNTEVLICPEDGMNVYGIWYRSVRLVEVDEGRMKEGATYGMPILFPTPNRVREGRFAWKHRSLRAQMHGFARKSVFEVTEERCTPYAAALTGCMEISEGTQLWEILYRDCFPFPSRLTVTVTVENDRLTYRYCVENTGTEELSYGLGLHPFFRNEDGQAQLHIGAEKVMEMTADQLPTGRLLDVSYGPEPIAVGDLSLDHVFTGLSDPAAVFTAQGVQITMQADGSFTHMVVYTPAGRPFFCVEPQTCSTDAHNLYAGGYAGESGLLTVEPGEVSKGTVVFSFQLP